MLRLALKPKSVYLFCFIPDGRPLHSTMPESDGTWAPKSEPPRRWKADGHLSAVMKDASGPRAKEVLERKAREHKVSFLS